MFSVLEGDGTSVLNAAALGVLSPSRADSRLGEPALNLLDGGDNNARGCSVMLSVDFNGAGFRSNECLLRAGSERGAPTILFVSTSTPREKYDPCPSSAVGDGFEDVLGAARLCTHVGLTAVQATVCATMIGEGSPNDGD